MVEPRQVMEIDVVMYSLEVEIVSEEELLSIKFNATLSLTTALTFDGMDGSGRSWPERTDD